MCSGERAELWAVKIGLEVTRDKGYQKLILKVGLESSRLGGNEIGTVSMRLWADLIRGVRGRRWKIHIKHNRDCNSCLVKPSPTLDVEFFTGITLVLSFWGYKHLQVPGEGNTAA